VGAAAGMTRAPAHVPAPVPVPVMALRTHPCTSIHAQVVCYDIEVVTGSQPDAGTTSRVYLELCGLAGSSGEHRLMYREGAGRCAFVAGATDAFKLHCRPLRELFKARACGLGGP